MSVIYKPRKKTPSRKGLLFIKSARTGGGAVKKFMIQIARQNGIHCTHNRRYSRGALKPENLKIINSGDYKVFTITRNPWDRFISSLAYYAASQGKYFETMFLTANGKLNLKKLEVLQEEHGCSKGGYSHMGLHLFSPIHETLEGVSDFEVLRYETLQKDVLRLCENLGLTVTFDSIPIVNRMGYKSPRSHYTDYYEEKSKQFIYDLFEKDIKMFDYFYEKKEKEKE
jgi:hypothetical protein